MIELDGQLTTYKTPADSHHELPRGKSPKALYVNAFFFTILGSLYKYLPQISVPFFPFLVTLAYTGTLDTEVTT